MIKIIKSSVLVIFFLWIMAGGDARVAIAAADSQPWTDTSWIVQTGPGTQSLKNPGDGIFTPRITPAGSTYRPVMTVEATQPEPNLANIMVPGKATGGSYIIKYSTGDQGGACIYNGSGHYMVESTGNLTFQFLADCGQLKRGYSFTICMLDKDLHCSAAPWWYFRGRTYAVKRQGIVVNGTSVYAWADADKASAQLLKIAASNASIQARAAGLGTKNGATSAPVHHITCRNDHPETKSYSLHEDTLGCVFKNLCNGASFPNVDALHDGDPIDWNSEAGLYAKKQNKITDTTNWICWVRTY